MPVQLNHNYGFFHKLQFMSQYNELEKLFKNNLEGMKVKPSESSWKLIEKKLFWKNFFQLSFQSFNVYYASAIVIVTVSGVIAVSEVNNDVFAEKKSNTEHIISEQISKKETLAKTSANFIVTENQALTQFQLSDDDVPLERNPSIEQKEHIPEKIKYRNSTSRITNNIANSSNTIHNKKDNVNKSNNLNLSSKINSDQINVEFKKRSFNLNQKYDKTDQNKPENSEIYFSFTDKPLNDDVIIYDTIRVYIHDTMKIVVFDTIHKSISPKIKSGSLSNLSIEAFYSPLIASSSYSTKIKEIEEGVSLLKRATTSASSVSYGINLNYQFRSWIFQTGFGIGCFSEEFDVKQIIKQYDTISYNTYVPNGGEYTTDTISWIFEYDPIGNAYVQVPLIEHYWITNYDTLLNQIPLVSTTEKYYRSRNKYSYFEVPVNIAYSYRVGDFSIEPNVGIIVGFFKSASGKTINGDANLGIVDIEENNTTFRKNVLSYRLGIGITYRLSEKFSILSEPYFRKTLQSVYNDSHSFSQKYNVTGLKIGIRYRF
jgi:hypothetical protein